MALLYTNDKTTQILVSLLKAHHIRKVVVSPGTTNMCFVASIQHDSWFELYSSIDERSAAYIACGLSHESSEPVVITCTEATASRNYLPGLTEAYYRKLPILAITGFHNLDNVGHLNSQVIDRSQTPFDTVRISVTARTCRDSKDEWAVNVNINKAILALTHNGGGPAHINLQFPGNVGFNVKDLPNVRVIRRITLDDTFPTLPSGRTAIFVGSHKKWTSELTKAVDRFCEVNNAVVFCDSTSGYMGKYRVKFSLVATQKYFHSKNFSPDLLIHIGEVSGDTYTQSKLKTARMTWRVNEDGEVRDCFHNLEYVFQMSEMRFFTHYGKESDKSQSVNSYFSECHAQMEYVRSKVPEFAFSNLWIAQQLSQILPTNSAVQLGIFNSLRSLNMNDLPENVQSDCNVGGFGIDGTISTAMGRALVHPDKTYYCICGDLAFFYDMNVLGNRNFPNNLRIMVINNGRGTEFRNYGHPAYELGDIADPFIAAAGHFSNRSIIRSFVEGLGFEYLSATNKESFKQIIGRFVDEEKSTAPIVFEVFTETKDETTSIKLLRNAAVDKSMKDTIKGIIGKDTVDSLKKLIKR